MQLLKLIDRGYYTTLGCIDDNTRRISNSVRKSGANYQCRRKVIRGLKKQKLVKNKKLEGKVYGTRNRRLTLFYFIHLAFSWFCIVYVLLHFLGWFVKFAFGLIKNFKWYLLTLHVCSNLYKALLLSFFVGLTKLCKLTNNMFFIAKTLIAFFAKHVFYLWRQRYLKNYSSNHHEIFTTDKLYIDACNDTGIFGCGMWN